MARDSKASKSTKQSAPKAASASPAALIAPEHAAFLVPGVSVIAASRDARLVPSVSRGVACRVSEDRRSLTVLLRRTPAATVLRDIADSGWITTCHSQPSTHRTIQLKGRDARIEARPAGHRARAGLRRRLLRRTRTHRLHRSLRSHGAVLRSRGSRGGALHPHGNLLADARPQCRTAPRMSARHSALRAARTGAGARSDSRQSRDDGFRHRGLQ